MDRMLRSFAAVLSITGSPWIISGFIARLVLVFGQFLRRSVWRLGTVLGKSCRMLVGNVGGFRVAWHPRVAWCRVF